MSKVPATRDDIDEVLDLMRTLMQQTHNEFEVIKERMSSYDQKLDKLTNTIDGFVARIDRYETEMAARDSQFQKLLAWAHKVSEKTGIPLENL